MTQEIIYSKYARYYDLFFQSKDYKGEAERVTALIKRYKKSPGNDLLDAGCGTGQHLSHFKKSFSCTGIDKYEAMLRIARKRLRGVRFIRGDMATFRSTKRFDAITCLFNSIAYVQSLPKLRATMANFARHLKPGGVIIIEPYVTWATPRKDNFRVSTYKGKGIAAVRVSTTRYVGKKAIRRAIVVIIDGNKRLSSFAEGRDLGLFSASETLSAMEAAGLRGTFLKQGLTKKIGLYVGAK